jgi:glutaminase
MTDTAPERNSPVALDILTTLTQVQLIKWFQVAQTQSSKGRVIDRVPQLAAAKAHWFAAHLHLGLHQSYSLGDTDRPFAFMSVIKPFLLLYLLEHLGHEAVFQWVGVEPSDAPFNSLGQLVADQGRPRNPMINSGAIALADKLPGASGSERCQALCNWLNEKAGSQLSLDEAMLESVRLVGREANQAIAYYLLERGRLENVAIALDTYEQICCLSGKVSDLAAVGKLLAYDTPEIQSFHRRTVNALMLTSGLYETSATFAIRIGLPIKSGISGALLAILPGRGTIACYSPAVDKTGNSVVGLAFIELLSQKLALSIFE